MVVATSSIIGFLFRRIGGFQMGSSSITELCFRGIVGIESESSPLSVESTSMTSRIFLLRRMPDNCNSEAPIDLLAVAAESTFDRRRDEDFVAPTFLSRVDDAKSTINDTGMTPSFDIAADSTFESTRAFVIGCVPVVVAKSTFDDRSNFGCCWGTVGVPAEEMTAKDLAGTSTTWASVAGWKRLKGGERC